MKRRRQAGTTAGTTTAGTAMAQFFSASLTLCLITAKDARRGMRKAELRYLANPESPGKYPQPTRCDLSISKFPCL
jgi:hypothetical protein